MTKELVCSVCQEVTKHKWVRNKVVEVSICSHTRGLYKCAECGALRMSLARTWERHCRACKKRTEHRYLGTTVYMVPATETEERKVDKEGWYECSKCGRCSVGCVQGE